MTDRVRFTAASVALLALAGCGAQKGPIGLLALLASKTRNFLTFRWTAIDTGTEIVVTGQPPGGAGGARRRSRGSA
jgi:hypothetical protein